jgi:hypothetical protein
MFIFIFYNNIGPSIIIRITINNNSIGPPIILLIIINNSIIGPSITILIIINNNSIGPPIILLIIINNSIIGPSIIIKIITNNKSIGFTSDHNQHYVLGNSCVLSASATSSNVLPNSRSMTQLGKCTGPRITVRVPI